MRRLLLFFCLVVGMAGRAGAQGMPVNGPGSTLSEAPRSRIRGVPQLPYGLALLARFDLLPLLRDSRCVQDSSYDRNGKNGDLGNFVRREGRAAVLADIRGPGCIYRVWTANADGRLRIFFDDESKPRVDCAFQDWFSGKVAPFAPPLVGRKSGGWLSLFPLPFRTRCRIEVTDPGSLYYQVQYQLFPDKTPVRTFTPTLTPEEEKALDAIQEQWAFPGSDPKPPAPNASEISGQATLPAGQSRRLATVNGPAQIDALRIRIAPADRFTLRQTLLRITWDGAKRPAVEAPLGDFFGVGFGRKRFAALPTALSDEGGVCYWPMPFAKSARIELVNTSGKDLSAVSWRITSRRLPRPLAGAGYFHARWRRETAEAGKPLTLLKLKGHGHFVGVNLSMQGDHGLWFLEGDEEIRVDGEAFPSIQGTGTEDYFNGGWYFDEGPFALPLHGCPVKENDLSRIAAYRYQIADCVPFQREIDARIEHGGANDYPGADYACVAYWYQAAPQPELPPLDLAQLTPAVLRTQGALEMESLPVAAGDAKVESDAALPEEASGGKFVALNGGEHSFRFSVSEEDVYIVTLAQPVAPGTALLASRWWLDGDRWTEAELPPDEGVLEPNLRHSTSTTLRLSPGEHTLTVSVPPGKRTLLDALRLTPSRKEPGVVEAESLLARAESGGKAALTRVDAAYFWSGMSALHWKPEKAGETLRLPLTVPEDGDYALELGATPHPDGLRFTAQAGEGTPTAEIDTFVERLDTQRVSERYRSDRLYRLTAGEHWITLRAAGERPGAKPPARSPVLWLDYLALRKARYAGILEAEHLRVLETKQGQAARQDMKPFGPEWSGDAQFWLLTQKEGAEATLELPVRKAGRYVLSAYFTTARDYGTVLVLLNGQPLGSPTDAYSEKVTITGKISLGEVELPAGYHRLTFRVVGRNPQSSGYLIGVDAIGLESAQKPEGGRP